MEHLSLKQLNFYPLTTHFIVKAVNLETSEIKISKDIVYYEYSTKYLKYFKFLNMQGYNVFFLPARKGRGRVDFLLDDLKEESIDELIKDGLKPLYILETSPSNFQAILRFNIAIEDKDEYLEINRYFVKKYNADAGSIGTEHFFRLSGYTNRKGKYCRNGQYPFVKLTAPVSGDALDKSLLPILPRKSKIPKKDNINTTAPLPPLAAGEKKTTTVATGMFQRYIEMQKPAGISLCLIGKQQELRLRRDFLKMKSLRLFANIRLTLKQEKKDILTII